MFYVLGPPAPVTWAAMISRDKGVGNTGAVPAGAVPTKPPSAIPTKPTETKAEPSQAPQPQRAPRYQLNSTSEMLTSLKILIVQMRPGWGS